MKYAIITPTFKPHFKYIKKYLKSFDNFVLDKDNVEIIFTISRNEEDDFKEIIKKYPNINSRINLFEDLLEKYNIQYTPDELLEKYKKFTFQTLKKFYTMLYSDADYFLVLDSESMWIKETYMKNVFEEFIKAPFISGSSIPKRKIIDNFTQGVNDNINYLLGMNTDKWFLENFVWFYDKKILKDMFEKYGYPIQMAEKIYKLKDKQKCKSGIFEIELYQAYVYHHRENYDYKFIDVDEILENKFSKKNLEDYLNDYHNIFGGGSGLLEHSMMLLNEENYKLLAEVFNENHFNIIRCNYSDFENIQLQEKFIDIVSPNILAASQEHSFGLKTPFVELVIKNNAYRKIIKHIQRLCSKKDVFEIIPILYFIFLFPFNYFINCYKYRRLYVK